MSVKYSKRNLLLIMAMVVLPCGGSAVIAGEGEGGVMYGDYRVKEALENFVIPRLNFTDGNLIDVCGYIQRMLKIYVDQITEKDVNIPVIPAEEVANLRVDLQAKNISAMAALGMLKEKYGLKIEIRDGKVFVSRAKRMKMNRRANQ